MTTENKNEKTESIFPGEDSPHFRRKVHIDELKPNIKNTISSIKNEWTKPNYGFLMR